MNSCRVMLVDDHTVFRETLAVGINHYGGQPNDQPMSVVAEAGTTSDCLALLSQIEIDVLVLDLSLPGRGGADLVAQIRSRFPNIRILILSAHPADQFVRRLVEEGASGYLHKSCSLTEVTGAIHQVFSGLKVLGEELGDLMQQQESSAALPHEQLSNREYQVMERLVAGSRVSEIAEEMNLSVKTISTYRRRLLEKLGVQSNSEIVSYAIHNGLADV